LKHIVVSFIGRRVARKRPRVQKLRESRGGREGGQIRLGLYLDREETDKEEREEEIHGKANGRGNQ